MGWFAYPSEKLTGSKMHETKSCRQVCHKHQGKVALCSKDWCVQVYKGRLKSTGEEVALKVQRPGIGEQICIDMVLLRRLMMTVDATLPKLRLPLQVLLFLRKACPVA